MGETVASRVAHKGTMFTVIVEAPNLVYERESSDKHDRYGMLWILSRALSIMDYQWMLFI